MSEIQKVRKIVEEQQYDDLAFWKNPELLRKKGKIASGFEMHGSALAIHGKGVIITGKSEAGKSTNWVHLLQRGGKAISEDLTNVVLGKKALLVAPNSQHAFRTHYKFYELTGGGPIRTTSRKMKSGRPVHWFREAPLDEKAQGEGRELKLVFFLSHRRLNHRAHPLILHISKEHLAGKIASEANVTFPSFFDLPETHSNSSVKKLTLSQRQEIAQRLVDKLSRRGVQFFKVYSPLHRDASRKSLTAHAISNFVRGFTGGFKPGLNLIAINEPHSGQVFSIQRPTVIGREGKIKITGDAAMEKQHTALTGSGTRWHLRDLNTREHTHVITKKRMEEGKFNWTRAVGKVRINHGDLIAVGKTFFQAVIK